MENILSPYIKGYSQQNKQKIKLHTPAAFDGMRRAGKLAAQTLDYLAPHVQAGISTLTLNNLCHDFIVANNAIPATLGYRGFQHSTCISVNHVVCHGIPSANKILKSGDILNIDVTVILDGWYGDTSRMFSIGKINVRAQKLIDVTYECMMRAIECIKPGTTLGDVGHTIQTYAESNGFSIVRDFCGHGLGLAFHEHPEVLHYGSPNQGVILEEGMFFTIEPMINAGKYQVKVLEDNWTAVTKDKSLSAQYEHSIGVTADGYEIFTLSN